MATRGEESLAPVLNSMTVPLLLLSGILLPMSLAPGWLDIVSWFTPLCYVVDGIRAAFLGQYSSKHSAVAVAERPTCHSA